MPRDAGVTLVDVILGAALVALVASLALPGFKLAEDTIETGGCRDRLERAADLALSGTAAVLRSGRVVLSAAGAGPPAATVYPVRKDLDIAELSGDDPVVFDTEPVVLRFRPVRELTEAGVATDLNRDGDRSDTFVLGVLETEQAGETRPFVGRPLVVLALPDWSGDLDGDGAADPLFAETDGMIAVNIHLLDRDDNGRFARTSVHSTLKLRNKESPR